jgi:hypothetical protein
MVTSRARSQGEGGGYVREQKLHGQVQRGKHACEGCRGLNVCWVLGLGFKVWDFLGLF